MGCISTKHTVNSVHRIAPTQPAPGTQPNSFAQDNSAISHTDRKDVTADVRNPILNDTLNSKTPALSSIQASPEHKKHDPVPEQPQVQQAKPVEQKAPEQKVEEKPQEEKKPKETKKKEKPAEVKEQKPKRKIEPKPEIAAVEKEIYTTFKKLGFSKYDEIFSKASMLLVSAEKVRSGIEDSKEKSIRLSNTFLLKEYSLLETVRVLLWAVSANCKGKIASTGIEVYSEAPFMKLPQLKKMMDEALELYNAFAKYLKSVTEGSDVIKNIEESLSELSEQAKGLVQQGHKEISESNLKEEEKQKIIERLDRYAEKYLPNELQKTKKLLPLIQKELEEMANIAPKLKELIDTADEVGAKVHAEYAQQLKDAADPEQAEDAEFILAPARIFNMYSTALTKSPNEVEAHLAQTKLDAESALQGKINREKEDKD